MYGVYRTGTAVLVRLPNTDCTKRFVTPYLHTMNMLVVLLTLYQHTKRRRYPKLVPGPLSPYKCSLLMVPPGVASAVAGKSPVQCLRLTSHALALAFAAEHGG